MKNTLFVLLLIGLATSCVNFLKPSRDRSMADWPEYNGDGARSHYSALEQINKANVKKYTTVHFLLGIYFVSYLADY